MPAVGILWQAVFLCDDIPQVPCRFVHLLVHDRHIELGLRRQLHLRGLEPLRLLFRRLRPTPDQTFLELVEAWWRDEHVNHVESEFLRALLDAARTLQVDLEDCRHVPCQVLTYGFQRRAVVRHAMNDGGFEELPRLLPAQEFGFAYEPVVHAIAFPRPWIARGGGDRNPDLRMRLA